MVNISFFCFSKTLSLICQKLKLHFYPGNSRLFALKLNKIASNSVFCLSCVAPYAVVLASLTNMTHIAPSIWAPFFNRVPQESGTWVHLKALLQPGPCYEQYYKVIEQKVIDNVTENGELKHLRVWVKSRPLGSAGKPNLSEIMWVKSWLALLCFDSPCASTSQTCHSKDECVTLAGCVNFFSAFCLCKRSTSFSIHPPKPHEHACSSAQGDMFDSCSYIFTSLALQ